MKNKYDVVDPILEKVNEFTNKINVTGIEDYNYNDTLKRLFILEINIVLQTNSYSHLANIFNMKVQLVESELQANKQNQSSATALLKIARAALDIAKKIVQ